MRCSMEDGIVAEFNKILYKEINTFFEILIGGIYRGEKDGQIGIA